MKTLKIINHHTGDYTVDVNHVNGTNTSHDFDSHNSLTRFVQDLKNDGYLVINDIV